MNGDYICVVWCEKRFFYYRGKRGFKIFYLEGKKINIFIDIVIEIIIYLFIINLIVVDLMVSFIIIRLYVCYKFLVLFGMRVIYLLKIN